MIARLKGVLAETGTDHGVIDVQGVGYLVLLSGRTLSAIGEIGNDVLLLTDMQVREDAITLFGFGSAAERDWFRLLTSVQGVGGKVALNILTALAPDELVRAIGAQDKAMVARANGVGPKLAERIVRELKDKVGSLALLGPGALGSTPVPKGSHAADAVSALANLGFKPNEAANAVQAAQDELGDSASLDALVRLALKKASR
ncbi:Holliday junction branch migration protein RuvA [Aquisediminimonas sediminicola]|uniref:Holliday junction branch migration protein RuvA n=1 Tax=Alteraquisediminimonas sediminicola TaxID=2676787 RepID=UPI001C8EA488|nr:Holliday junction branch migration protein RuvA [Aquisediminimonas sediminicola]